MSVSQPQFLPFSSEPLEDMSHFLWQASADAIISIGESEIALNPAAHALLAKTAAALLPASSEEVKRPAAPPAELLGRLLAELCQALATDRHHLDSGDGRQSDAFFANGEELCFHGRWFSVRTFPSAGGRHHYMARDISERKFFAGEMERLQETNIELNEIIELSADGLVSVDHSGKILRLNSAYKRILGIKNENFVGQPATSLVEKGYLQELVSPHVLRDHKAKNIVVPVKGKEVLLTGRPVFNENGRLVRVVANIRDLTTLNRLKNELQRYHELANRYETEISHLRAREIESEIIGCSTSTTRMLALASQASRVDSTVLVYGETGTGKEVLVKTIHKLSERREGPFIAVNCSSIPESLIESELFGYEAGSFTDSNKKGKIGLFEAANGGTFFLDEISEMSLATQAKVLRVIQERNIRRIGASRDNPIDVRIIAASNRRLKECIGDGTFRADLFYRLDIISIDIPPLRQRKEDIPLLINYFLDKYNKKFNRTKSIPEKEILLLLSYDWPGNIRELENMIERYVVLSSGLFLDSTTLDEGRGRAEPPAGRVTCLRSHLRAEEERLIDEAYRRCRSTRKTAEALNVSQSTIVRRLGKSLTRR